MDGVPRGDYPGCEKPIGIEEAYTANPLVHCENLVKIY
jgi:hypothetical protein